MFMRFLFCCSPLHVPFAALVFISPRYGLHTYLVRFKRSCDENEIAFYLEQGDKGLEGERELLLTVRVTYRSQLLGT